MVKVKRVKKDNPGIFIEADFDYSHFIPEHRKCYPLHGHTSKVIVYLYGKLVGLDMILDFAEAKKLVKDAISIIDHKLITGKKYVIQESNDMVIVSYGKFRFELPKDNVFIIDGEATSENIAKAIANYIMTKAPENVHEIQVQVYEGVNKGAVATASRDSM